MTTSSQPLRSAQQHSLEKKKNIQSKTILVGMFTLASRMFGLIREYLMVQFLGVGVISDAFLTAYKVPNSLRKIFSDGALSAAFVPTVVGIVKKESKEEVNKLMTLSFLFFEGILILLCTLIFWQAHFVMRIIAPGWFIDSSLSLQASYAIACLRIVIGLIVFFSSSALLAGALQAVNHFFIPAFCPVMLNIVVITGFLICIYFKYSVTTLCYFFLCGGLCQFLLHLIMYLRLNFNFSAPTDNTWSHFYQILKKFFPCLFSKGILEINLFISTSLATYLQSGSISLINYANRFMGIPLGVFAEAFSTILLPHFSHVSTYAPKRLSFYLFEAAKLIFWVTVPITLIMGFLADKIFITLFLSNKFSLEQAHQAAYLLIIFLMGLFFFSLNKILLNIFYSLHETISLIAISCAILISNYLLCKLFISSWGIAGLAAAFVLSSFIQTLLCIAILVKQFKLILFIKHYIRFMIQASLHIASFFLLFLCSYQCCSLLISWYLSSYWSHFLLNKLGLWLWVLPLIGALSMALMKTRPYFKIHLYFLD